MLLRTILAALVLATVAVIASTTRPGGPAPAVRAASMPVPVWPAPTDAELKLAQRLPHVRFKRVPLEAALDHLREQTGLNMVVHWGRLEADGLSREAPVDVDLRDVTLSQALHHLLAAVERPNLRLGWKVENGIIVIGPGDELLGATILKIYDVGDLIQKEIAWRAAAGAPPLYPNLTFQSTMPAHRGVDSSDEHWAGQMDALTSLVQVAVAADTWRNNGGSVGALYEFNGRLVIEQTWENHQQIAALLDAIRSRGVAAVAATRPARPEPTTRPEEGGNP